MRFWWVLLLIMKGIYIKVVDHFNYLDAYSSSDGTNTKELLSYRLGKVAGIFRELDKIWKNRCINLPTKMQFYNACVMSTFLYGAECRTLKGKDEKRLDAFDMRCQRKILKIRWSQYVTKHRQTQENQSAPIVQRHQKASSAKVWASAAYGRDSITT